MNTNAGEHASSNDEDELPFALTYVFDPQHHPSVGSFNCVATFPWDAGSIQELWKGSLSRPAEARNTQGTVARWNKTCERYSGSFAIGSDNGDVEVWSTNPSADLKDDKPVKRLLHVSLKDVNMPKFISS